MRKKLLLWLAQHEPAQVFRPDVMIRLKPIGSLNVLNSPKSGVVTEIYETENWIGRKW